MIDTGEVVRGLYPILGPEVLPLADLPAAARMAADHGVRTLQLRLKDAPDAVRLDVQRAVARALEGWSGLMVVNDRPDLAYVLSMEHPELRVGLHLGQEDMPPVLARVIVGPGVPIGLSTHNLEQARAARSEPIDYLAFGPIFHTTTKSRPDPIVGVEGLRAICRQVELPVVAIGGIGPDRARQVYKAGARAIAVASALFGSGGPLVTSELERRLTEFASAEADALGSTAPPSRGHA